MYPHDCAVKSIKGQYQALLLHHELSEDPNFPPDIKWAKAIDRLLKAKQEAGNISADNCWSMEVMGSCTVIETVDKKYTKIARKAF